MLTDEKKNAHSVCSGVSVEDEVRTRIVAQNDVERREKDFRTAQAHAALHGLQLMRDDSGGYIVARWALTRWCRTLDEALDLLRRMGVA